MRILIAEDDSRLLKSLVHIFELNNYAVDGVDNSKKDEENGDLLYRSSPFPNLF